MNLYNKFTKNFTETEQKTAHVIHRMWCATRQENNEK